MTCKPSHHVNVQMCDGHVVHRRQFMRQVSTATLAAGALSWTDLISLKADEVRKRERACILLWMQGGPSQFETFDPKPGQTNGGSTKAIGTAVSGIQISESLPHVAKGMKDVALIRSLTSKEGSHPRASYLLHTGYLPTPSVKYPAFGSIVSQQLRRPQLELPAFVRIGSGLQNGSGGGLLGSNFDPLVMPLAGQLPANTRLTTDEQRHGRRLDLLDHLEQQAEDTWRPEVADHQSLYRRASRMVLSPQMHAFDLEREPAAVREQYGKSQFGMSCLAARRLVESGVPFVEVVLNGWDTHADNFERTAKLAAEVDQPLAALVEDLKQRGLLDSTLVVWMGEFGRTPRINPQGGRDHFPTASNVVLAGGGVRGGQVIGKTDEAGAAIADRPVTVADLFQSFCRSLGINAGLQNTTSTGRPIKIVDGGRVVSELFG